jgi:prefoldin beta subunit
LSRGISPQLEEKIKQYQKMQQDINSTQQQMQTFRVEIIEIEKAQKEIEDLPDDEICYRSIGRLMIKSSIKDTKQKLSDQKELYETRTKLAEKNLNKLKEKFDDLEKEIKAALETGEKDEN